MTSAAPAGRLPPFVRVAPQPVQRLIAPWVEQLYAAVGDEQALADACRSLGRSLGTSIIGLHHYDYRSAARSHISNVEGIDRSLVAQYPHLAPINVWMSNARGLVHPGAITVSHLMYPDELLERTQWYSDFLRPRRVFHSMGCVLGMAAGVTTTVSFLRARRLGNFTSEEQLRLRALGPHMENAFRLHSRLREVEVGAALRQQTLDLLAVAVLLVGPGDAVLAANRAARGLLEADDGVALLGDRLTATVASSATRLRAALAAALRGRGADDRPVGGTVLVMRRSDRRPYRVWVAPLHGITGLVSDRAPAAAVFIDDLDAEPQPCRAAETMTALYHLSPAEARLAVLVGTGVPLREAAERLGITTNTARTHLSHIFDKTATSRQGELVRLVAAIPTNWNDEPAVPQGPGRPRERAGPSSR